PARSRRETAHSCACFAGQNSVRDPDPRFCRRTKGTRGHNSAAVWSDAKNAKTCEAKNENKLELDRQFGTTALPANVGTALQQAPTITLEHVRELQSTPPDE